MTHFHHRFVARATLFATLLVPQPYIRTINPVRGLTAFRDSTSPGLQDTTLEARLATITTDTGAFAPGHRDFSRYTTPSMCRAAARVTRERFRRSLEEQLGRTSGEDTVGVGATALVARACGARFRTTNTVARDLVELVDLALHEQDDSLFRAALDKLVAQAPTSADSASLWSEGLRSALQFGRDTAAAALVTRINARGPSARTAQLMMANVLSERYRYHWTDRERERAAAERVLQLTAQSPKVLDFYSYWSERDAWSIVMKVIAWDHLDSMPILAARAKQALSQYQHTPEVTKTIFWYPWPSMSVDSVGMMLGPTWYTFQQHGGAGLAPRLQADQWIPAPGRPKSDTIRPVPGKVNLICAGARLTDEMQRLQEPKFSGFAQASELRRLLAKYGQEQLEITLVRPAEGAASIGYQRYQFDKWFSTPSEEGQFWRWYEQDYEALPVTIAMQQRQYTWLPQPDGRRAAQVKIQFNDFWRHDPGVSARQQEQRTHGFKADSIYGERPGEGDGNCVVIDRDGAIVYTSYFDDDFGNYDGTVTELMIEKLFQKSGTPMAGLAHASH